MAWLRITLEVKSDLADTLSDQLEGLGSLAVTLSGPGQGAIFDEPDATRKTWPVVTVSALFDPDCDPGEVLHGLRQGLATADLPPHRIERLADQDWERAWMERYRPIHVGGRLWVCPSWQDPPRPDAINLILDPGLAFGSGSHPTTRLCLEWLARHPPLGQTVLDVGCGSGVLAIAALKLGASVAWGVDIDPQALAASHANARRNAVADRLQLGRPGDLPDALRTDIVLANILAETLLRLQPDIGRRVRAGGQLLLSGILAAQSPAVRDRYAAGFDLQQTERDGWVLLHGSNRG